jgi:hypothetical protein
VPISETNVIIVTSDLRPGKAFPRSSAVRYSDEEKQIRLEKVFALRLQAHLSLTSAPKIRTRVQWKMLSSTYSTNHGINASGLELQIVLVEIRNFRNNLYGLRDPNVFLCSRSVIDPWC